MFEENPGHLVSPAPAFGIGAASEEPGKESDRKDGIAPAAQRFCRDGMRQQE